MLKQLIKKGLNAVDDLAVATGHNAAGPESLVNVLFHSLYQNEAQLASRDLAPNQNVTVANFRDFVEKMLESGCTIVSPAQIDAGLAPGRRYLSITFDDGYFNNVLALEVLDQFRFPATFFVSTDHVQQNKAFWWDAFSREFSRSGVSPDQQKSEIEQLKVMTPEKIEAYLCQRFGPAVLRPYGDIDRPFTPRELGQFALNPWVHVGNHTRDCAILTNCTPAEMVDQITACQDALAVLLPSPIPTATARMLPCRRPKQPGCVWASPWRRAAHGFRWTATPPCCSADSFFMAARTSGGNAACWVPASFPAIRSRR